MKIYYQHFTGFLYDFDVMSDSPTKQFVEKSELDLVMKELSDMREVLEKLHSKAYMAAYNDKLSAVDTNKLRFAVESARKALEKGTNGTR